MLNVAPKSGTVRSGPEDQRMEKHSNTPSLFTHTRNSVAAFVSIVN